MRPMKISKQLLAVVLFASLLTSFFAMMVRAADIEKEGEILKVGVPTDRCPIFYRDAETGDITGIGVDLMRAAAENAGYTADFCSIGEGNLKEALDDEKYDVIMPFGSAITSSSGKESIISDNLFQTPFTLVTEGGGKLPPLNSLKVGMLKSLGGAAETVQQLFPGMEIKMYGNMEECVRALRKDEVDALLHNSYVWSYVLQKPSYISLKVQPTIMFSMDFRAGTLDTERGQAVIEKLNKGIAKLSETGVQAIILDHTSRKLYKYDFSDYLYQYGLIMFLIVITFVLLIMILVVRQRAIHLEQEEKMRRLIDQDTLTCVLSLNGFRKRAEKLIREHPDYSYFISYNNIKGFKYINDSLGRDASDELLRFWADITMKNLSDEEAAGRIDGDHFVVLRRIEGEKKFRQDEKYVIEPVKNYFVARGKDMSIQICSGLYVLTPKDHQDIDIDRMLDFARVAEKRLKESGKEGYEFYNPNQWEKGKRTTEIIGHFQIALKSNEVDVWYHPQVNFVSGEIIGTEALCRWKHPKLGWISPAEFIPILEESGQIYDLDYFVWDRVCYNLKRWNEQGIHMSVSVNLSRCDIKREKDIPKVFKELTEKYGIMADQLRIEITESAYTEEPELIIRTTDKLRELGFTVEMDDFGSGYSSLNMLKEVSVDRIKLDLHFLEGKGDEEKSRVILRYMIRMVRALGMELIAEGVENGDQASLLQGLGCDEMQGFYFYKPMPLQEFEALETKNEN